MLSSHHAHPNRANLAWLPGQGLPAHVHTGCLPNYHTRVLHALQGQFIQLQLPGLQLFTLFKK